MKFSRIVPSLLLLTLTIALPQRAGPMKRAVTQGAEEKDRWTVLCARSGVRDEQCQVFSQHMAVAEKGWKPFFETLRVAVQKHDRTELKKVMADFNGAETPEDVFKRWDNPRTRGWDNLTRILNLGSTYDEPLASQMDAGDVPLRTAPLAANGKHYKGWLAVFKYYFDGNAEDGKWRFVQFTKFPS